jgi:hypothetical protein
MWTDVHERLARVVARFEGGRIEPLELRWGLRDLQVRSVNARWIDRAVRPAKRYFSVTLATGEILVISWTEGEAGWELEALGNRQ